MKNIHPIASYLLKTWYLPILLGIVLDTLFTFVVDYNCYIDSSYISTFFQNTLIVAFSIFAINVPASIFFGLVAEAIFSMQDHKGSKSIKPRLQVIAFGFLSFLFSHGWLGSTLVDYKYIPQEALDGRLVVFIMVLLIAFIALASFKKAEIAQELEDIDHLIE